MIIRTIHNPPYDRRKDKGLTGKSPADYMKKKDQDSQLSFLEVYEAALEKDIQRLMGK